MGGEWSGYGLCQKFNNMFTYTRQNCNFFNSSGSMSVPMKNKMQGKQE